MNETGEVDGVIHMVQKDDKIYVSEELFTIIEMAIIYAVGLHKVAILLMIILIKMIVSKVVQGQWLNITA